MKKIIFIGAICLLAGIVVGAYFGSKSHPMVAAAVNPVGTINTTPRFAQIVANSASNGSYVSAGNNYLMATIPNADANDRVITSVDYFYDSLGTVATSTANLTVKAATSSDATTLNSNTNYLLNTTVATSTPVLFIASTTPGSTGTNAFRIWAAGSNLNFVANATTSSNMIIVVRYLAE